MRHARITAALSAVLTGFGTGPALADSGVLDRLEPASLHASAIEQARTEVAKLIDAGVPGASVAVGVGGELVWSEGFGYANVELEVPVTPLTKFRVGSIAKAMTSVAMGVLVERGKLDLDAPLSTYLTEFADKPAAAVSARALSSHRGSIRHYREDGSDYLVTRHYDTVIEGLELFIDDPLIAPPWHQFTYTSHGYNLLSAVLERAAGTPFLELMRAEVFAPMRLQHTVADQVAQIITHRAAPYQRGANGQVQNAPFTDNSYKWAGGAYLSTPEDLVRFGFGVLNDRVISQTTRELLWTRPTLPDGRVAEQAYGLGWFFYEPREGEPAALSWVGHGGGSVGGNTLFQIQPERGVVIAIVCNLTGCLQANPDIEAARSGFVN